MFAIEILVADKWVLCETDGKKYLADSREEAEIEAKFSLDNDTSWRVVEA